MSDGVSTVLAGQCRRPATEPSPYDYQPTVGLMKVF
jgi:hypothetical protein